MKKIRRSFNRILAMALKEWIQIRRDTRSLILSLLVPVLLVLVFGYALSIDVKHISTAFIDQDRSAFSRQFLDRFAHTEYLDIYGNLPGYGDIDRLLKSGKVKMALVVPPDFEKRFRAGKTADLQLLVDGSDSTTATVATGYIKLILFEFNREVKEKELNSLGVSGDLQPVDVRTRVWYNSELKSSNFIIPGVIVLVMAIISALITSLTISREWERGTMETLITTPLRRYELLIGKIIPYIFIALFDVIITVALGYFLFRVPLRGSFIELYLVTLLFLVGTSGLGMLISSATRSQVLSVQVAIIISYLPTFVLSGFIFPITNMPSAVQAMTYVIPARYLITYMKGIYLKGIGYSLLWTQIVFLFIFALVVTAVCVSKLSLKLPED
jgi:ABC-2 type transport system permease protein